MEDCGRAEVAGCSRSPRALDELRARRPVVEPARFDRDHVVTHIDDDYHVEHPDHGAARHDCAAGTRNQCRRGRDGCSAADQPA